MKPTTCEVSFQQILQNEHEVFLKDYKTPKVLHLMCLFFNIL